MIFNMIEKVNSSGGGGNEDAIIGRTIFGGHSTLTGQYGSIYVPASLYNDFIVATNWSSISSRIVSL